MKSFAAALVQAMDKQSKFQSHVGCYTLLKWSCLLLSKSQFATVSRNALCRVAAAQTSLLHIVMQRSIFSWEKGMHKNFFAFIFSGLLWLTFLVSRKLSCWLFPFIFLVCFLFLQSPDVYNIYIEEIKDARIPYKDTPELLCLLLEFSSSVPSKFEQSKVGVAWYQLCYYVRIPYNFWESSRFCCLMFTCIHWALLEV